MSKLLYIQSSPRGQRSHSIAVADAFVDVYRQQNPNDQIITLNLFTSDLPPFDGQLIDAKYNILHGKEPSPQQRTAWVLVESMISQFTSADKYLLAVPMWNFGIPYRLKQYIDILVQPTYTFSYSPQKGYSGLVTGKPMLVVYVRGGQYCPGSGAEALDLQSRYLECIMQFIGFTDIQSIIVEPTLMGGPEVSKTKQDAAIAQAKQKGTTF